MENGNLQTTSGQLYLDKDFSVELNFKLWTTKGARFIASHRLRAVNRLSSYAVGFLSAYLIIAGMLSAFKLGTTISISPEQFTFISTGLSILILVFSQLESANDYRLRAEKYHDCALEIGELYNKLRFIKTSKHTLDEVNKLSYELSKEYDLVLKKYENHTRIDFRYFQTTKNDYFKLSKSEILKINVKYYFRTSFLYHSLIVVPLIIIIWILS
jgi:hypothetical protein